MPIETLAEMINEGFKTTASKEDINRVEVRLDRIEHLLLAKQKREIEDLKQRMKRLEDALGAFLCPSPALFGADPRHQAVPVASTRTLLIPGIRIVTEKETDLLSNVMAVFSCLQVQERHGHVCSSIGTAEITRGRNYTTRPSSRVRPSVPRPGSSFDTSRCIQLPRRHGLGRPHLRERCEVLQGFHTGHGGLRSLHLEVLVEKLLVRLMLVKVLGREHEGDDWDVGVKLDLHQGVNDRGGDKFMPIDPAVDDQPSRTILCYEHPIANKSSHPLLPALPREGRDQERHAQNPPRGTPALGL